MSPAKSSRRALAKRSTDRNVSGIRRLINNTKAHIPQDLRAYAGRMFQRVGVTTAKKAQMSLNVVHPWERHLKRDSLLVLRMQVSTTMLP